MQICWVLFKKFMIETINYKKTISPKELEREFDSIFRETEHSKFPSGFMQFVLYALAELFANVKEHSKSTRVYLAVKIDKNCLIRVEDDGIGVRNSYLSKNIYPKDDSSAIELAIAGLSTKDFKERGYGLYSIKKFIESFNGKMEIKSGASSVEIQKNKIQFKKVSKKVKGTCILLEIKVQDIDFYKIIR